MDSNKKQPALIYLDTKGFYYYGTGQTAVLSLGFTETSVKDMDVIDSASITLQIKSFIDQNKLSPSTIYVVASPNAVFEKDIVGLAPEAQEEAVKKFTDIIPFESVLSRSYSIDKGIKVIGCNEELFTELKISFEKNMFIVNSIVPYQMLGSDKDLLQNFVVDNVALLLKKMDRYKQFSLQVAEKDKPQVTSNGEKTVSSTTTVAPKKFNKRLILMGVVFAVLFVVLGYMIVNMKP